MKAKIRLVEKNLNWAFVVCFIGLLISIGFNNAPLGILSMFGIIYTGYELEAKLD